MENVARCVIGIEELDNILNGGNTVLVTGSCGTGKTTLNLEFLVHGCENDETSLYLLVTEASEKLFKNMIPYTFLTDEILKSKKMIAIDLPDIYEKLGLNKLEFSMDELEILM